MIAKIIQNLTNFFSKNKPGILIQILAAKAASSVAKEILDPKNQKKAFIFVKELHLRTDLDNKMKAKVFNKMMYDWLKMLGKCAEESVVNCLRELAVNAFKCDSQH